MPRFFAVFGATGRTGMPCVQELVRQGHRVRAIVRSASSASKASQLGAEPVVAAADDAAAMTAALVGVDGLFLVIPTDAQGWANMIDVSRQLANAVIGAAVAAKVPHVVAVSSIGAQHAKGTGPIVHCRNLELALAASGLPHTIVRAASFFENWRRNVADALEADEAAAAAGDSKKAAALQLRCMYQHPGHRFPQCAAADVGVACAQMLVEGAPAAARKGGNSSSSVTAPRRVVELHGPQEYSADDVAAALGEVLGRAVKVNVTPLQGHMAELRGSGMSATNAAIFAELFDGSAAGLIEFEGHEQRRGSVTLVQSLRAMVACEQPARARAAAPAASVPVRR